MEFVAFVDCCFICKLLGRGIEINYGRIIFKKNKLLIRDLLLIIIQSNRLLENI